MVRLLFVFITSFSLCYLSLWGTKGEASPLFSNVNPVLFVLGALFGALSLAFFNYVEGVLKDIPKKLKQQKPKAFIMVVEALTDLKHEVIINVVLVVVFLMVAFVVGAVSEMPFMQSVEPLNYLMWAALSVRGACLISVLVVMCVQLAGFVTANKLRAEVSMSGE
ncbi:hypothetical protein C1X59_24430 [Pseudomonas sp. FW215-R2]|uniref:hypothetical protein n=1 Tax=unclassified Pseudomonas TaxID=196821 RepID=UPI000C88E805|nr:MULTISPECIES: hypothetical protein [unclassified Pseudomonas]PMW96609.1 hypothetical protein C1X59_24430 [Pseudomonas sp. FW215-R2]PMX05983.1 hypothetical protein C1X60_25890 [Pseudomonas sp. FW215-L1]PMX15554.1 hypothetical protein C1X57_29805 [Pseudomonas sp. FW215-E1]PNA22638.1 hypothetical protein C1X58_26780 [Pseudomonas sp. FW215-R4]